MITCQTSELRRNTKSIFDMTKNDAVFIPRPKNENVVVISEAQFNEYEKIKRNYED
ncbi:MAG: hypothetical protein LBN22_01735 [Clostridiales Family XIII bacterium]|jgi:antitoxin YefM|nr:hypothetical protein [Clostridiales Family XIII bacterium]